MLPLLLLLDVVSSPAHIDVVLKDLATPWPSPPMSNANNINNGISSSSASTSSSSSSSSPMRFTALHVTMIFIAILLCVIICAIPWDNIKCSSGGGGGGHDHLEENAAPQDEEQQQQHNHHHQSSGLSKRMIKSFQLVRYGSSSLREKAERESAGGGCWSECMICLSDFRNGQMVRILPHCTHGFHKKCIEQWLHSHTSCPICRNVLLVLDSPAKPSTNNAAAAGVVSASRDQHNTSEALALAHHRHHHHHHHHHRHHHHQQQQQQEQVVVDLERVDEDEEDADGDADDAGDRDHHHHSVYRSHVVISD